MVKEKSKTVKTGKPKKTQLKSTAVKTEKKEQDLKMVNGVKRQTLRGLVVAAKSEKTVTVLIESRKRHPLYKKSYRRSKKYLVHDELKVTLGDVVDIVSCRPISKRKHFQVVKVVGKEIETLVSEELKEEAAQIIAEVMPEEEKNGQNK